MDTRRLEVFCEVHRQGSYSRAARRLGLTQSAVSQQVRALERDLGVALFQEEDRTAPTAAGASLFGEAQLLLAAVDDLIAGVRDVAGIGTGRVRLGMIDVAAIELMPPVFKVFKREHPAIVLESVVRTSGELIDLVAAGELDCAVVVTNEAGGELARRDIYEDSIVAVVPTESRFAGRRIDIAALRGEPLILYPPSSHSRRVIDAAFRDAGIVPAVAMEMHYPAAIIALVQEGMGIGLISELSAQRERGRGTAIVPVAELAGIRRIGVVTHRRRRLSPHAREFVDAVVRVAAQQKEGRSSRKRLRR